MKNLFSSKDIMIVFGTDRRIAGRLNKQYLHLVSMVDKNKNVPLEDRDAIYYAGLSILRHDLVDFMALIEEFKECKLISGSKYICAVHEINKLIQVMEKECVYD